MPPATGYQGYFTHNTFNETHYIDVIMTTMASQITILTVVYSTVYSDVVQRKHQSSASLAFVWGIHRDRWIPRTKGQLRGKCFHLMMSSWEMSSLSCHFCFSLNEGCQNVNFRCSWWRKYRQNDNFQFQYWGQNIMAAILQKIFQVAFLFKENSCFSIQMYPKLAPQVQLTIMCHCFWKWTGGDKVKQ